MRLDSELDMNAKKYLKRTFRMVANKINDDGLIYLMEYQDRLGNKIRFKEHILQIGYSADSNLSSASIAAMYVYDLLCILDQMKQISYARPLEIMEDDILRIIIDLRDASKGRNNTPSLYDRDESELVMQKDSAKANDRIQFPFSDKNHIPKENPPQSQDIDADGNPIYY